MVAGDVQRYARQGSGKAGVADFKGGGHDLEVEGLVEPENDDQVFRSVLIGQFFDLFLGRKTYGSGGGSDEAGGGFVNDIRTGGFHAGVKGFTGDVVAFAEEDGFFPFEHETPHVLYLKMIVQWRRLKSLMSIQSRISFQDKGNPIEQMSATV